jgi:hypothetical protein
VTPSAALYVYCACFVPCDCSTLGSTIPGGIQTDAAINPGVSCPTASSAGKAACVTTVQHSFCAWLLCTPQLGQGMAELCCSSQPTAVVCCRQQWRPAPGQQWPLDWCGECGRAVGRTSCCVKVAHTTACAADLTHCAHTCLSQPALGRMGSCQAEAANNGHSRAPLTMLVPSTA